MVLGLVRRLLVVDLLSVDVVLDSGNWRQDMLTRLPKPR